MHIVGTSGCDMQEPAVILNEVASTRCGWLEWGLADEARAAHDPTIFHALL